MVIIISEFGIKIKNISAGTLYDVNLGTRDYFSYTEAMLNNSLFSAFLIKNGLNVYKGESTRDIICLDFDFGTRSYEDEHKRIEQLYKNSDGELKERLKYTLEKVENNKDLYDEKKREQIRDKFYNEGVDVTYKTKNKDGSIKSEETIHYEMLFRTSAKAKLGQVIFINSELYEVAYEWLTIGLGKLMTDDNAKIVEMSAYAPLTTSTIVGTKYIPVEDILILRDQDSFFKTMANIVRAEDYIDSKGRIGKKCVVDKKVTEVKNTLWDGMGLIEADYFKDCRNAYNPEWTVKINGMALMRHHLFKMCGFKSHIQLFFKDWCEKTGNDYETYQIQDMFGHWHYLKDIKIITTDNAIKWKKFKDLMGGSLESAYEYWCKKVNEDGSVFGVVKSDHPSKLGEYQQLSYQMVNTLPCTKDDVREIAVTKDGKELPQEDIEESKNKLKGRINKDLICPMNWLQEWLDKIQGASKTTTIPTENFFIKMNGKAQNIQASKIMETVINFDNYIREIKVVYGISEEYFDLLLAKTSEVTETISKMRIGNIVTINRLIEISLGLSNERGQSVNRKYNPQKYTRKILNILYHYDKERFLCNFLTNL